LSRLLGIDTPNRVSPDISPPMTYTTVVQNL